MMQFNIEDIGLIIPYTPHIIFFSVIILIIAFITLILKYIIGTGDIIKQMKKQNQILGGILIELRNKNSFSQKQEKPLEKIIEEMNKQKVTK